MNRKDIIRMAREAGFATSWTEAAGEALERFAGLVAAAERNKLAQWMMARGYATGHGDSIEDLLQELDWQIAENWTRGMVNGVEAERAACAKLCDELQDYPTVEARHCAEEIRARGQA